MCYFIKIIYNDDDGGTSEWITKANSKQEALAELESDMECVEIKEITIDECIAYEEDKMREAVKRDYLIRRLGNVTVKEYVQKQKELNRDPEKYYDALVDYNRMQRLTTRLSKTHNFRKLTIDEYHQTINALLDARTEEDFNDILHGVDIK